MGKVSVTPGVIYFVQVHGIRKIKIGFSTNLGKRLRDLQSGCPEKLLVLKTVRGTQATERLLHRIFSRFRSHGEWFEAHDALVQFINELKHRQFFTPEMFFTRKNISRNKK